MNGPAVIPAGSEPNLHLHECSRCKEPMYHHLLVEVEQHSLCSYWEMKCGECGHPATSWVYQGGKEPDRHLLECSSCQQPKEHQLLGLAAEYPLWYLWALQCGDCGNQVEAWEERPVPILFGGGKLLNPAEQEEDEIDEEESEFEEGVNPQYSTA